MISSVSGVKFRGEAPKAQAAKKKKDIQDLINRQGKFTKAEETQPVEEKKKGSAMKTIGKVLLAAVVVAGAMVGANKLGFKSQQLDDAAGWFKKGINKLAEGCEWVTKHTWDAAANLFKKGKADGIVEDAVDNIDDAAEAVS